MKGARLHLTLVTLALVGALAGCLEVEQHPGWAEGQYDGKTDNLPQQAYFHGDRLSWNAALTDRTHLQNEYSRTEHP